MSDTSPPDLGSRPKGGFFKKLLRWTLFGILILGGGFGAGLYYAGGRLSPAQEVLRLLGKGFTGTDIAAALGITPNTCASHTKAIYRKLNISSRAEAALAASRRGLI